MARTHSANGEHNESPASMNGFEQPAIYHGVTATGRGRGYFVRVPHMPVLDTIAEAYGAQVAQLWHGFMIRALTQIGGARGGAKGVAATREAEAIAISNAFEEVANGTYEARGDDVETAEANNKWNRALMQEARPRIVAALESKGLEPTEAYVAAAFKQYYPSLFAAYAEAAAAKGFEPTKKGEAKAATGKLDLSL